MLSYHFRHKHARGMPPSGPLYPFMMTGYAGGRSFTFGGNFHCSFSGELAKLAIAVPCYTPPADLDLSSAQDLNDDRSLTTYPESLCGERERRSTAM
jgi:hypothetical protein